MNKERLLNVAKALRETKFVAEFDMSRHVTECGTPACAFGNYAARYDLQDTFITFATTDRAAGILTRIDGKYAGYTSDAVLDHFDITSEESNELFGSGRDRLDDEDSTYGRLDRTCKTPEEAAAYIERFVETHVLPMAPMG